MAFTGEKEPQKNPDNFALGPPLQVAYGLLRDRYTPKYDVAVGSTVAVLLGAFKIGKVVKIGANLFAERLSALT